MTYVDKTFITRADTQDSSDNAGQRTREPLLVVIEDGVLLSDTLRTVCECLNVEVVRMPSRDDLSTLLRAHRPMAVVAEMDAAGQDGCHVMMTIAAHDCSLPVLLITGEDPALLGAVDAVQEIWRLSSVAKWPRLLGVGAVVDFLFRAGRKGGCMQLMSV
jgi:hypothetical protein